MNRWTGMLMIPLLVFVTILAVWGGTILVIGSAAVIAVILKNFTTWLFLTLPVLLTRTFSDPWKVISLPIAVGLIIVVGYYLWLDFVNSNQLQVLRGRELGKSRSRERTRRSFSGKPSGMRNEKKPWTPRSQGRR